MTPSPDDLDQLLAGLCDDDLSDADRDRLAARLRTDPTARERYLYWLDLHASLALEVEDRSLPAAARAAADRAPPPSRPGRFRPKPWLLAAALAASLLVATVALRTTVPPPTFPPPGFAELVEVDGAAWSDPALPTETGGVLPAGQAELRTGRVTVRMTCGAELTLTAPCRVELVDPKSVRLHAGRLAARVPDAGVGFRVTTKTADVIDLGTEFGVVVEDTGATEVHVAEGVVVARATGGSVVVPLLRHEAGRVDLEQTELAPVPFDPTRFPGLRADVGTGPAVPVAPRPIPADARVVFLGDEAVARETSLLLVSQALGNGPKPRLHNAGVALPLLFQEADYQRYVARFRPTHAVMVFGPEIARHADQFLMPPDQFRAAVTRLADRLAADRVEIVVATGYPLDATAYPDGQRRLGEYNRFLRALARDRSYRLADVEAAFRAASARGTTMLVPNGREPNFEGHRQLARAVLDALGRAEVQVPDALDLAPLPGLIGRWQVKSLPPDAVSLDAAAVAALRPDGTWQTLVLPQPADRFARRLAHPSHSAGYRDRTRGMATGLTPPAGRLVATATVTADRDRDAVVNTGGAVRAVWVNGMRVYKWDGQWRGSYPGVERVPVALRAGNNQVVIEAGPSFFLSVTDAVDWPVP